MPIENQENPDNQGEDVEDDEELDEENEIEDYDGKIDDNPQKLETQNEDYYEISKNRIKNLPGVGEATFKKLINAGFSSLESIAFTAPSIIQDWCGLGEKTVEKLIRCSFDMLNIKTKSAKTIWREREKMHKLSSNAPEFDELLKGGFEPGTLTELVGEFRTGKTQLCHQLCVNVQLPTDKGGLSGKAYYIDTNNSFRSERIIQMAECLDLNYEDILEGIFVDRAYNSDHQFRLVKNTENVIRKYGIKLLIIDNIISHILAELTGRGTLDLRRMWVRTHLNDLLRLVAIFPELVIVYTNQVYEKPDVFYGNPLSALGGNELAHGAHTRILLRKGNGEERVAKVVKSPFLPDCEAVFSITDGGIMD